MQPVRVTCGLYCAGRRYTLAPSPRWGDLGEPSRKDGPAGAPVLQQGVPELKSTTWQRVVASGEVGQRRLPPVSGVESASGPDPRDVCTHTAMVALTGGGSSTLCGRCLEASLEASAFRAAGGLALWASLSRRGCGFGTWAAGLGVPPSKSRHRSGCQKNVIHYSI